MLKGTSEIQTHPKYGTTIKCFSEGDGRFFSFGVAKARKVLANLEAIIAMVEESDGELTGIEVVRNV